MADDWNQLDELTLILELAGQNSGSRTTAGLLNSLRRVQPNARGFPDTSGRVLSCARALIAAKVICRRDPMSTVGYTSEYLVLAPGASWRDVAEALLAWESERRLMPTIEYVAVQSGRSSSHNITEVPRVG